MFQSWTQLASYLVSVSLVLGVAYLVLHAAGERLAIEPVMGGAIGALAAVQIVQRTSFKVSGPRVGSAIYILEERLARSGFIREPDSKQGVTHYRHKLPRWLTFRENDVFLHRGGEGIAIYGPHYLVKSLRKAVVTPD